MRTLVFINSSVLGGLITFGIFPNAPVFGLEPDLVLIFSLCCVLLDETPVPVIYTSVITVFADLFYTGGVGTYTVPYVAVLLAAMWIFKGRQKDRLIVPSAVCAAAFLIKELLSAFTVFLGGRTFDFFSVLVSRTLLETLINSVLMLGIYQIYYIIFEKRSVKINRMNSYVEKPRYEGAKGSIYKRSGK